MSATTVSMLPKRFWIIAVLALLWNLLGLAMFVMQVTMTPETLAAMPDAQRAVVEATPPWLDAVFGVAVASGVLGAVGLLLRRRWAVAMFALSLAAVLLQVLGGYLVTPAWSTSGPAGLTLPALLIAIAIALLGYARTAARRGWLA